MPRLKPALVGLPAALIRGPRKKRIRSWVLTWKKGLASTREWLSAVVGAATNRFHSVWARMSARLMAAMGAACERIKSWLWPGPPAAPAGGGELVKRPRAGRPARTGATSAAAPAGAGTSG